MKQAQYTPQTISSTPSLASVLAQELAKAERDVARLEMLVACSDPAHLPYKKALRKAKARLVEVETWMKKNG